MRVTLQQAMNDAATAVYIERSKVGSEVFDKAVAHHIKLNLTANLSKGTTQNKYGQQTRFLAYDWEDQYIEAPHFVWFDFFLGAILNSVSRIQRGLSN